MNTRRTMERIRSLGRNHHAEVRFLSIVLLFFGSFILYSFLVPVFNIGDGFSVFIAAKKLVEDGNLNFWNFYNEAYNSYFFSYTFHDIVMVESGEIYPLQFVGTIVLYSLALKIGGYPLFALVSPLSAAFSILGIFFLSEEINKTLMKSVIPAVILSLSPVFVVWALFPGNAMLSAMFFVYAALFALRCTKDFSNRNIIGFSVTSSMMILTRYPNVILAMALMAYLLFSIHITKVPGSDEESIRTAFLITVLPVLISGACLLLLNYLLFQDPFFVAYFHKNQIPSLATGAQSPVGTYTWEIFSPSRLLAVADYLVTYALYSNLLLPLFVISIFGLLPYLVGFSPLGNDYSRDHKKGFGILFLFSWLICMVYYGALSGMFWSGNLSPTAPHFRYLLPTYAILPVASVFGLESLQNLLKEGFGDRIRKRKPSRSDLQTMLIIGILLVPSVFAFNYQQVKWIEDMDNHMQAYNSEDIPLESGSVILYGSRWPLLLLRSQADDYVWFYYEGIPEVHRENMTLNMVEELLSNNETVLIFSSKYNLPGENAIIESLEEAYQLNPIIGTYFEKLDSIFYRIEFQ